MSMPKEYLSPQDAKALAEEDKRRALAIARIQEIMKTQGFVEMMNLLLDITNFNGVNYIGDRDQLVYMEGRRSVFHELLPTLEECDATFYPKLLLTRAQEYQDGRTRYNVDHRTDDDTADDGDDFASDDDYDFPTAGGNY